MNLKSNSVKMVHSNRVLLRKKAFKGNPKNAWPLRNPGKRVHSIRVLLRKKAFRGNPKNAWALRDPVKRVHLSASDPAPDFKAKKRSRSVVDSDPECASNACEPARKKAGYGKSK